MLTEWNSAPISIGQAHSLVERVHSDGWFMTAGRDDDDTHYAEDRYICRIWDNVDSYVYRHENFPDVIGGAVRRMRRDHG